MEMQEVTGAGRIIRKQLLDNSKETGKYCKVRERAIARSAGELTLEGTIDLS